MANLKILVTGAGAPGTAGTIYSVKGMGQVVGTDIRKDANYIISKTYQVPTPSKQFQDELIKIIEKEKVDVVLPQVTAELPFLAELKNVTKAKILVNTKEKISILNNKYKLLSNVKMFNKKCVGEFYFVKDLVEFKNIINNFKDNKCVVKLPSANGSRGVRILTNETPSEKEFYSKPHSLNMSKTNLLKIFEKNFPTEGIMVTEYLSGKEYSVDVLAKEGKTIICVPRSRDKIVNGITFEGQLENNKEIIKNTTEIIKKLSIHGVVGFQYKMNDKGRPILIECNPRIQGSMVNSTLGNANIIRGAIEQEINGKASLSQKNIIWGTKIYRYWGFANEDFPYTY
ncbi:MAG: ATP-grasp domain-containing protein [Methanofastidiosum sp.]